MLITTKRRYKKQHVIGGAGIFDSFMKLFTSNAAKQIASTAAKEIGKKAIDVGKTVAIDAGKRLVDKILAPKNTEVQPVVPVITQKTKDTLTKLINEAQTVNDVATTNINKMLSGSGSNAIAIQDLVKRLGAGMKVV
jgi:hypothetical protein